MSNNQNQNFPWTQEQLQILQSQRSAGATWGHISGLLGRTTKACRRKFEKLKQVGKEAEKIDHYTHPRWAGLKAPSPSDVAQAAVDNVQFVEPESKTVEEDRTRAGNDFWRREYKTLETKYEKVLKERSAIDQLVEMAVELAPKSYAAAPATRRPNNKGGGKGRPQSAVLLLSDCHIGQVVEPDQTQGFGRYDFPTFLHRLKYLEESVASILQDHTTTDVEELVVCLGGDFLHGALNHSAEAAQRNTLFTQFFAGSHAIAQFLRNVAPLAPKVRIYCTVGNHTRWGNQNKMPTEQRYSNLDSFLYAHVQALTRELPTLAWNIDAQPFALFDVQGFKFHLSHGDGLRGGDRALGIPNHSVARMISSTSQMFGKRGNPAPHYYLVGHLHRSIVLPHSKGSVIVNGGFPGIDGYGLASGFSAVDPIQVFFLVHPRYGKTATYDILLGNAKESETLPYEIPGGFPIV